MSSTFDDARLDEHGNLVDPTGDGGPAPELPAWYVTEPQTNLTQRVEADAESTARWVGWSQRYGARHRTDDEDRHYGALEVTPA